MKLLLLWNILNMYYNFHCTDWKTGGGKIKVYWMKQQLARLLHWPYFTMFTLTSLIEIKLKKSQNAKLFSLWVLITSTFS